MEVFSDFESTDAFLNRGTVSASVLMTFQNIWSHLDFVARWKVYIFYWNCAFRSCITAASLLEIKTTITTTTATATTATFLFWHQKVSIIDIEKYLYNKLDG